MRLQPRRPPPLLVVLAVVAACSSTPVPTTSPTASAARSPSMPAASPSATSSAAPTPTVAPSSTDAATRRIDIAGGPIGLDVAGGHAWVVATDAGRLVDVDLATGATRELDIGASASWVKALDDGRVVISRYAPSPGRGTLELIQPADGTATVVTREPIEGLDVDGVRIWAIAKGGEVLTADLAGTVLGRAPVAVAENEHTDVVGTGDAAYASSDSVPVHRVGGDPLAAGPAIETGGGVPFVADGGLVWGARPDELWAIDPAAGTVIRRFPLEGVMEVLDLDVDGDDAWLAVRHPGRVGAVIRLDLATGQQVLDVPADLPAAVVIEGDLAWVTDDSAGALLGFTR